MRWEVCGVTRRRPSSARDGAYSSTMIDLVNDVWKSESSSTLLHSARTRVTAAMICGFDRNVENANADLASLPSYPPTSTVPFSGTAFFTTGGSSIPSKIPVEVAPPADSACAASAR